MEKKLIVWVRPGVELVFTKFLRPNNIFIREDLPTLERPENAISGLSGGGYWEGFTALVTNSADLTFIGSKLFAQKAEENQSWLFVHF